jgi:putative transcriptional regulator
MGEIICKVKYYRTFEGLSQRELALLSGTAASTICEIESGKRIPNVLLAVKIARALGVPVEDLWDDR